MTFDNLGHMSTALYYKCDFKMMEVVKKIVYVHLCKCIEFDVKTQ